MRWTGREFSGFVAQSVKCAGEDDRKSSRTTDKWPGEGPKTLSWSAEGEGGIGPVTDLEIILIPCLVGRGGGDPIVCGQVNGPRPSPGGPMCL